MSIESEINKKFNWSQKQFEKRLRQIEPKLFQGYNNAYNSIRAKLNDLFEALNFKPDLNKAMQYNRLSNIQAQIINEMRLLDREAVKTVTGFIGNEFESKYYEIGFALETPLQTNLRFGLLNEETIKASVVNPYDQIKWQARMKNAHSGTANVMIQSDITEGLIRGDSYQKITRSLKETVGKSFSNNIMRIVRTEGARANSWGNLTALNQAQSYSKEAGLDMTKVWSATLDDVTRPMHRDMDQREEDDTEEGGFTLPDGNWTQAPGLSGIAEHDINERCTAVVKVDGITPKMRKDNITKQNIPYQSYNEYYQNKILKTKAPIKKPATLKVKVK